MNLLSKLKVNLLTGDRRHAKQSLLYGKTGVYSSKTLIVGYSLEPPQ